MLPARNLVGTLQKNPDGKICRLLEDRQAFMLQHQVDLRHRRIALIDCNHDPGIPLVLGLQDPLLSDLQSSVDFTAVHACADAKSYDLLPAWIPVTVDDVVHIVSTDVAPAKEFRQIYIVLRHIFVEVIGKTIISIFRILL